MLETVKLSVPATTDAEAQQLVELSRHDVELVRAKAMQRASTAMLAATAVLLLLMVGLLITLALGMHAIAEQLADISDAVGPTAVANLIGSVRVSLDNAAKSSSNVLDLTSDAGLVGERLVVAANETVNLLYTANAMASSLMAHPTISATLGGPPPAGQ